MMAKKEKINKRALIELFESKLEQNSNDSFLKFGESFESSVTKRTEYDWCSFLNKDKAEQNRGYLYSSRETHCFMRVTQFDGQYYLEFNTIHVLITPTEFFRIFKMLFQKRAFLQKNKNNINQEKDRNMLKQALLEKTESETRKIIIEKYENKN
jgi:hypothetical protein